MLPLERLRRVYLLGPATILLVMAASSAGSFGVERGAATSPAWPSKLDPFLRTLAVGTFKVRGHFKDVIPRHSREAALSLPSFLRMERTDAPVVQVKAGMSTGAVAAGRGWENLRPALAALGVEIRGRVEGVASLRVPVAALEPLARLPEIGWLKASHAYSLLNDVSTASGQIASDQANGAFDRGAGVIVGVVDTGIQWTDHDFRKANGTTRVLGIWDQTLTDPAHPPPSGFSFGAYYSQADIDAAIASASTLLTGDGHGHGTHVTGTSAGNGLETGNGVAAGTFAGVAPDADILVVRVFDDGGVFCDACDLTAAVQFIRQTAAAAGKPWVGNMSLGTDLGAHDGTDPDEMAFDAAVGPATRGALLAIAAGNSGSRDFSGHPNHWGGSLPLVGASVSNTFNLSYTPNSGDDTDHIWLDIWYEGADSITVEITTPTGGQGQGAIISAARGQDSGIVCTADGAVQVDATDAPDAVNGDNRVFVQIWDSGSCAPVAAPRNGTWSIRIQTNGVGSASPIFDLWTEADAGTLLYASLANSILGKSITIPGTSRQVITAGSYADKNQWVNVTGATSNVSLSTLSGVGSLSGFSSLGPTRDGRIKPDVAAPGEWVGSSLAGGIQASRGNTFTERDGVHGDIRGTSMATPHVAGTVALLFGINPALSGPEAKAAIQRSARSDSFTNAPGPLPNMYYGSGKLRALEAGYQAASIVTDLQATSSTAFGGSDSPFVDSYDVYRGTIPGISVTNYGACFLQGQPTPGFPDLSNPPRGQAYFYLVTGVHAGTEGILGVDSSGRIRPNNSPCL